MTTNNNTSVHVWQLLKSQSRLQLDHRFLETSTSCKDDWKRKLQFTASQEDALQSSRTMNNVGLATIYYRSVADHTFTEKSRNCRNGW